MLKGRIWALLLLSGNNQDFGAICCVLVRARSLLKERKVRCSGEHQSAGCRTTEWLGRDLKEPPPPPPPPPPPATGRATNLLISYQPRLPRAPSNLALNTSRDGWGIHSLSGQLLQHLTTLIVKNFHLISNLNFPPST